MQPKMRWGKGRYKLSVLSSHILYQCTSHLYSLSLSKTTLILNSIQHLIQMSPFFKDVLTDRHGNYYYNYEDIPKASVPISDVSEGDFNLSKDQLKYWFDLSDKTMPNLPKFLIRPRLNSKWGGDSWWNITGDVVVYRPKKWVPNISRTKTYPRSAIETALTETTTTTTTTKLYAGAEASLEVSTGASFWGMKVEAKAKVETTISAQRDYVKVSELKTEGKLGDRVVHELWVSMLLEVEEVYSHDLKFWVENTGGKHNIGWSGGPAWENIWIANESLRYMDGLKFHPIQMSGSGHSDSIHLVTLPVFKGKGNDKDIDKLHVALSCNDWVDWYAYVTGEEGPSHRTQLMAWPAFSATPTLVAIE